MSLWSRTTNVFRNDRLSGELAEELEAHLADAVEAGQNPAEAAARLARSCANVRNAATSSSSPGSIPCAPMPSSAGGSF